MTRTGGHAAVSQCSDFYFLKMRPLNNLRGGFVLEGDLAGPISAAAPRSLQTVTFGVLDGSGEQVKSFFI